MSTYRRVPVCAHCGKKINRNQKMGAKSRITWPKGRGTLAPPGAQETRYFHSPDCYRADDQSSD